MLDGWCAEAYTPEVGWALGDGQEHGNDPAWDAVEGDPLYDVLEQEVIQAFYIRDGNGIPTAWIKRMRGSMARLIPRYSANRPVRKNTERRYLPAAATYRTRAAHKGACGPQILNWRHKLDQHWSALRFGDGKVVTHGEEHIFEVTVHLDYFDPEAERVELYANSVGGDIPHRQEMSGIRQLAGSVGGQVYHASVSSAGQARGHTARVIPHCNEMAIPWKRLTSCGNVD